MHHAEATAADASGRTPPISIPAYVAHYTRSPQRLPALTAQLDDVGLSAFIVTAFDKEQLSDADLDCFVLAQGSTKLSEGEISLSLKHYWMYSDIVRHRRAASLVLEDDAIFGDGFATALQDTLAALETHSFDFAFVGGCLDLKPAVPVAFSHGSLSFYRTNLSRCSHGYIVSLEGARKMLRYLPFDDPIDFHINVHNETLASYWVEPSFVDQNKAFESSGIRDGKAKAYK